MHPADNDFIDGSHPGESHHFRIDGRNLLIGDGLIEIAFNQVGEALV